MKIQNLFPELILSNGKLYTMDGPDTATGTIDHAVAIKDGRILAVGGDAEIRALAGLGTLCIDLNGRAVIPASLTATTTSSRWGPNCP